MINSKSGISFFTAPDFSGEAFLKLEGCFGLKNLKLNDSLRGSTAQRSGVPVLSSDSVMGTAWVQLYAWQEM